MTGPNLPPLYEVITLDRVRDICAEAVRRAEHGAEEGTLIWTRTQSGGHGRGGTHWESPPDGLYAALVLRPECARARAGELAMVTTVSLGEAIADRVVALTDLRYRWPNDILISQAKAATVNLAADGTHRDPEWVVATIQANVASSPDGLGLAAASLHGDGGTQANPEELLESFARAFLSWINRWADDGPTPIARAWRLRASGPGSTTCLHLDGATLEGRIEEIEDDGTLRLTDGGGQIHRIALERAFGLARGAQ